MSIFIGIAEEGIVLSDTESDLDFVIPIEAWPVVFEGFSQADLMVKQMKLEKK